MSFEKKRFLASEWKVYCPRYFPSCSKFERRAGGQTVGCDNSSLESPRVCLPSLYICPVKHFFLWRKHIFLCSVLIPDCVQALWPQHAGEGKIVAKPKQISPDNAQNTTVLRMSWTWNVDVLFLCVLCSEATFAVYLYLIWRENMAKLAGIGGAAIA